MSLHISLDFWHTLGTPNPAFTKARNAYLATYLEVSEETVAAQYTSVKRYLDRGAEELGIGLKSEACWEMLLGQFGRRGAAGAIAGDVRRLFRFHPPSILPETVAQINRLASKGVTFSIGSNVNFISGYVIEEVFVGPAYIAFDFALFSDQLGVSKPSPRFFAEVKRLAGDKEVLHIGDNVVADFNGAQTAGLKAHLVKNALDLPAFLATVMP